MTSLATQIRELSATGLSQRKIATELGISRHRVRAALNTSSALAKDEPQTRAPVDDITIKGLAGRASQEKAGMSRLYRGFTDQMMDVETHRAFGVDGRLLDPTAIKSMPIDRLVEVATNVSPEMNRALWDYLRMAVNGYEIETYEPGTETPDETAQEILNRFRAQLKWRHGDESVIYRRLFIAAWMRGMMIAELEMDQRGVFPVNIVTPDPAQFTFRSREGEWVIGQWQDNQWVPMDRPTFRYVSLDPYPGRPEGRAPVSSSLFPALFLLGLYQDLRRVIANQGYPRLNISINTEILQNILETDERELTVQEFDAQVDQLAGLVADKIRNVGPGDAYVHADLISMEGSMGTIDGDLSDIDSVISGLERMATRALKSTPLMMSLGDLAGESNANRQWEMWGEGIDSVQKPAENLLGSIYELALQAYGVIADVRVRFAKIRASEAFRDAQTRRVELTNIGYMQDRGWYTPREAAEEAVGFVSDAVAAAYGEDIDGYGGDMGGSTDAESDVPDPGEPGDGAERTPAQILAQRIGELVPAVPSAVPVADGDERAASRQFDRTEPEYAGLLESEIA